MPDNLFRPRLSHLFPVALLPTLLLIFVLVCGAKGAEAAPVPEVRFQDMTLPSTAPSGEDLVDIIRFRLYPAAAEGRFGSPAPSVIIVPQTGSDYRGDATMRRFGEYLAQQGLNAVIITLPYHGERKRPKDTSSVRFFGGTPAQNARSFYQSGADIRRVVDWLQNESPRSVDRKRFGIVGISLGAIVAHLAMGLDPRLSVGAAALGSGDLADLYRSSLLVQALRLKHPVPEIRSEEDFLPLSAVDPLTYADRNRPRRVLMIQAARDLVIPPRDAVKLWHALGEPPIQWLDINHFALSLVPENVMRASLSWFDQAWIPDSDPRKTRIPDLSVPTLKAGMIALAGGDGHVIVTPALQWQFHTFARRRDHLSLLHLNAGISDRGVLLGAGLTVNAFVDVGLMSRVALTRLPSSLPFRPYISLHVVY